MPTTSVFWLDRDVRQWNGIIKSVMHRGGYPYKIINHGTQKISFNPQHAHYNLEACTIWRWDTPHITNTRPSSTIIMTWLGLTTPGIYYVTHISYDIHFYSNAMTHYSGFVYNGIRLYCTTNCNVPINKYQCFIGAHGRMVYVFFLDRYQCLWAFSFQVANDKCPSFQTYYG